MNWNLIIAVAISVAIHATIVSCVPTKGGNSEQGSTQPQEGNSFDKPVIISAFIEEDSKKNTVPEKGDLASALSDPVCAGEQFYVGMGLIRELNGLISDIAKGGPADRAGLRVGDILINHADYTPNSLPIGKELTVQVYRDAQTLTFTIVIGKVCYQDQ